MDYRSRMLEHLAVYKTDVLGIQEWGIWKNNDKSYPHILPIDNRHLNILEGIRKSFWNDPRVVSQDKLHSDFHHLNSSQAMCFNFFYPFFQNAESDPSLLLEILGFSGNSVDFWEFEHVPDTTEGTHFDFCLKLNGGPKLLFEVKLTESGYGTCEPDKAHEIKLETIYEPALSGKVSSKYLQSDRFFKNYQLLRNVSYVEPDGSVLLYTLLPRANLSIIQETNLLEEILEPQVMMNVRTIRLEDAVAYFKSDSRDPFLQEYFDAFAFKYIPYG